MIRNETKTILSKRKARILNRKANYGIGTEYKEYKKLINDTFFDEKLFNEYIIKPEYSENLSDGFNLYLSALNEKINGIWQDISNIITKSFNKGTKKVFDKDGNRVKIGEIKDKRGIDFIIANQQRYLKNLARDQAIKVSKVIADGRNKGLSVTQIVNKMQSEVKSLTKSRATTIARTEIVRSHNQGQLQTMKELEIEKYDYVTAGDDRVSDICRRYEQEGIERGGYIVSLAGTESNPLPSTNSHPNCRCMVVVH